VDARNGGAWPFSGKSGCVGKSFAGESVLYEATQQLMRFSWMPVLGDLAAFAQVNEATVFVVDF